MGIVDWITLGLALLVISHPLRLIPLFMKLSIDYHPEEFKRIVTISFITILTAFIISIWLGEALLILFGLTLGDFQIAGGLFLITLGLRMMRPEGLVFRDKKGKITLGSIIVPLAIPWIAGPGAFTVVIVEAHKYNNFLDKLYMSCSVFFISSMVAILLYFSSKICKYCGKERIDAVARLTGLIVITMAIEILTQGIYKNFPILGVY